MRRRHADIRNRSWGPTMRMRAYLLGLSAALVFVAQTAQAASVKEVFEKYNLLGQWAQDCTKPADAQKNWTYRNRAIDDDHVQRDFMSGPDKRQRFAIFDKASARGPDEIEISGVVTGRLFGADHDEQPTTNVWRVEKNRMVPICGSIAGKAFVAYGKLIANGGQMPWLTKCE